MIKAMISATIFKYRDMVYDYTHIRFAAGDGCLSTGAIFPSSSPDAFRVIAVVGRIPIPGKRSRRSGPRS